MFVKLKIIVNKFAGDPFVALKQSTPSFHLIINEKVIS
jgi:hypothetical protein